MMRCLQENLSQPQFSEACRQEVAKREEAMQADFRENAGLASTCAPEIEDHCQAEQARLAMRLQVMRLIVMRSCTPCNSFFHHLSGNR